MKTLVPLLIVFSLGLLFLENPLSKLLATSIGLLFLIKIAALIRNHQQSLPLPKGLDTLVYLFGWPGLRPESFSCRMPQEKSVGREFVKGFLFFISGIFLQILLFFCWQYLHPILRSYLGLASFLLLIHFGCSSLLFSLYRMYGWPVEELFRSPFRSSSLADFWGRRWNTPFVDMNKRLVLPFFPKKAPKPLILIGIFIVSGILHEMAISFPANGGWGGPLIYFTLQGILTWVDGRIPWKSARSFTRRAFLWLTLLVPFPILFHLPFLSTFIDPYFTYFHSILSELSVGEILHWMLFACGLGHLLVLVASSQVPKKLGWKADFSRLSPFNRKIFWTYGGYIVFCILFFAIVDLFMTDSLLDKHLISIALASFIALFWSARVTIDFTYFKHHDWPKGDSFVIGHTLLTTLFCCLALSHWTLLLWHTF